MIINSRASAFVFSFGSGFFSEKVEEKYLPIIKRLPLPFDDLYSYMSHTVQSVTFPSLSMDVVQQTRRLGKKQEYKSSQPVLDLFSKTMTVSFKTVDSYINYFVFLQNAMDYLDFDNDKMYFDDFYIRFLSQEEGAVLTSVRFSGMVLTNISEISLSYSDNSPEFKSFDATFNYNFLEFVIEKG